MTPFLRIDLLHVSETVNLLRSAFAGREGSEPTHLYATEGLEVPEGLGLQLTRVKLPSGEQSHFVAMGLEPDREAAALRAAGFELSTDTVADAQPGDDTVRPEFQALLDQLAAKAADDQAKDNARAGDGPEVVGSEDENYDAALDAAAAEEDADAEDAEA